MNETTQTPPIVLELAGLGQVINEVVKQAVRDTLRSELEALKAGAIAPSTTEGETTPRYLTRAQVCELLSVSQTTLTAWKRKGILPIHKVGGRTLYKREDIDKAVKAQRGARTGSKSNLRS